MNLEKGGQGSIKVVDNGEGMDPSDAPLAFERYATSKIRGFEDITGGLVASLSPLFFLQKRLVIDVQCFPESLRHFLEVSISLGHNVRLAT